MYVYKGISARLTNPSQTTTTTASSSEYIDLADLSSSGSPPDGSRLLHVQRDRWRFRPRRPYRCVRTIRYRSIWSIDTVSIDTCRSAAASLSWPYDRWLSLYVAVERHRYALCVARLDYPDHPLLDRSSVIVAQRHSNGPVIDDDPYSTASQVQRCCRPHSHDPRPHGHTAPRHLTAVDFTDAAGGPRTTVLVQYGRAESARQNGASVPSVGAPPPSTHVDSPCHKCRRLFCATGRCGQIGCGMSRHSPVQGAWRWMPYLSVHASQVPQRSPSKRLHLSTGLVSAGGKSISRFVGRSFVWTYCPGLVESC
jgi:hypothetical protein